MNMPLFEVNRQDEDNYYWVKIKCNNCGRVDELAFTVGVLVEEHTCPCCECNALSKREES